MRGLLTVYFVKRISPMLIKYWYYIFYLLMALPFVSEKTDFRSMTDTLGGTHKDLLLLGPASAL